MSAPHRTALLTRRDPLALDAEVERAAEHYLYWSGKPLTDESRVRASSQIRGLCSGKPVGSFMYSSWWMSCWRAWAVRALPPPRAAAAPP